MVLILKVRSIAGAAVVGVAVLAVTGALLFRVDAVLGTRVEVALTGKWGSLEGEFGRGVTADGRPRGPTAIAVDVYGNIVVADSVHGRIQVFDRRGILLGRLSAPVDTGTLLTGEPRAPELDPSAAFGLLLPCLSWGSDFRPTPDLVAPAGVSHHHPVSGGLGTAAGRAGRAYITALGLSPGGWKATPSADPAGLSAGPVIYLLGGWDGTLFAVEGNGSLIWQRHLNFLDDPGDAPQAFHLAGLGVLADGRVVVTGYALAADSLLHFMKLVPGPDDPVVDLAAHTLTRQGEVLVDEGLPIRLEVESMVVGSDGLLHVAAVPPAMGEPGGHSDRPFRRDIWTFTPSGGRKGKLTLECETYTRYLDLVGVDKRGLIYTCLGGRGIVAVFSRTGEMVLSWPQGEGFEAAAVCLGGDGCVYLSQATDEGFKVLRYTVTQGRRVTWRWARG